MAKWPPDAFPSTRILLPWGLKSPGGRCVPSKTAVWDGSMYFVQDAPPLGITIARTWRVPPNVRNAWGRDEGPRTRETYGEWRERNPLAPSPRTEGPTDGPA